jgi:hypothetical protein
VARAANEHPPIELEDLPAALANATRAAFDKGDWSDAIAIFEDWLDEHAQRLPAVLAMLAFMVFRDAVEVMVDEVAERGGAALALLDEAKLDTTRTRELRRQIKRAIQRDQQRNKDAERLTERPLESFGRYELRELAYKLGDSTQRKARAKAARAWILASEFETKEWQKKDCLGRAALHFAAADEWSEATPRLREILAHPDDYDDWFADSAWGCFLDKAVADGNTTAFHTHWQAALAMPRAKLFPYFPYPLPSQEEYLVFAIKHRLIDVVKHIVDVVTTHRSPRERKPIAELLEQAQSMIGR